MSAPTVAPGDMPTPQERMETGKLALSIVTLVQRGPAGAADLHALLQTMTLRELALSLGSMGALVAAPCDHMDGVATAVGLPPQASDIIRQVLNVFGQAQHRG